MKSTLLHIMLATSSLAAGIAQAQQHEEECVDVPGWSDIYGGYKCDDYDPFWCDEYGGSPNEDGLTVDEACCVCKGIGSEIKNEDGLCLDFVAGYRYPGYRYGGITMRACNGSSRQRWYMTSDGQIKNVAYKTQCLTIGELISDLYYEAEFDECSDHSLNTSGAQKWYLRNDEIVDDYPKQRIQFELETEFDDGCGYGYCFTGYSGKPCDESNTVTGQPIQYKFEADLDMFLYFVR